MKEKGLDVDVTATTVDEAKENILAVLRKCNLGKSVSYTHLDVYKRQEIVRGETPAQAKTAGSRRTSRTHKKDKPETA